MGIIKIRPPSQGCCEIVGNSKKSLRAVPNIPITQQKFTLVILNDDHVMMATPRGNGGSDGDVG